MCSPEAFPEGSMTDPPFVPGERGFFHLPCAATTSCRISQMPFLSLQMSVLLLSSFFQCCLPVQQSIHVLCPHALATGRFEAKVFTWRKWHNSIEIQLLPVCVYQVFMAYLTCRLKSTDFLCWHVRIKPYFCTVQKFMICIFWMPWKVPLKCWFSSLLNLTLKESVPAVVRWQYCFP